MEKSKLFGRVASKLHAHYTKQTTGSAPPWKGLPKEEKRAWVAVARRAVSMLGSEQFAPLFKPAGELPSGNGKSEGNLPAKESEEPTREAQAAREPLSS